MPIQGSTYHVRQPGTYVPGTVSDESSKREVVEKYFGSMVCGGIGLTVIYIIILFLAGNIGEPEASEIPLNSTIQFFKSCKGLMSAKDLETVWNNVKAVKENITQTNLTLQTALPPQIYQFFTEKLDNLTTTLTELREVHLNARPALIKCYYDNLEVYYGHDQNVQLFFFGLYHMMMLVSLLGWIRLLNDNWSKGFQCLVFRYLVIFSVSHFICSAIIAYLIWDYKFSKVNQRYLPDFLLPV